MSKGFGDPNAAMAMRDVLRTMVTEEIDSQRPKPLQGTVLRVQDSGPEFRVAPAGLPVDPSGPPGVSSGNPRQIAYATIRLDNGEEIVARCHDDEPVARDALYYDPLNPAGEVGSILIYQGVYRYAALVTVIDDFGVSTDTIQPDMTRFMPNEPFVPPRVQVRGSAGKYYVEGIIRGLAKFDGAVIDNAFIMHRNFAGNIGDEIVTYSSELVYNKQGRLLNTAFDYQSGFDIEMTYNGNIQRYIIPAGLLKTAPWDSWMIVPPVYENAAAKNDGYPSDTILNVLLIYIQGGSVVNFYVCNRSYGQFSVAADLYLGGQIVVRSLNGKLKTIDGLSLPSGYDTLTWNTLGYTDADVTEKTNVSYSRPAGTTVLASEIESLRHRMTGGGKVTLTSDGTVRRLKWSTRFIVMAAKSIYTQSGFYNIDTPPIGTVIPVVGVNAGDGLDPTARDVTTDGINVNGWGGLYYVLPIGSNSASVPGNFVWVLYTGYFDIPANWVLVFASNIDASGADGRLGTGRDCSVWRDCVVSQGFSHGSSHAQFKVQDGLVLMRGFITNTSGSTKQNVTMTGFFPTGYEPGKIHIAPYLQLDGSNATKNVGRNDISSGGDFVVRQNVADGDSIYFDGVTIPYE